jgi:hypothetical protein
VTAKADDSVIGYSLSSKTLQSSGSGEEESAEDGKNVAIAPEVGDVSGWVLWLTMIIILA